MKPLALTWLGQASFVVRAADTAVVIDLFLSDHEMRTYAPPTYDCVPGDVTWFLCSHLHGDHFDADALRGLAMRGTINVVVPAQAVDFARSELPDAAVHGLGAGETMRVGDFSVTGIGVMHGDEITDAYRDGPYLAFVLKADGFPGLLHSGDSIPSAGLLDATKSMQPDVYLLPINGRDWFREREGFVGNMNAEEAARFAIEAGARFVVPMHYDAIVGNTADPADLVRHIRNRGGEQTVLIPARGRPILIAGGDE